MNTKSLLAALSIGALLVTACEGTDTTAPASGETPDIRAAKATAPGYTAIEIGTWPGDIEGYAPAVNNYGHVVVSSSYFSNTEPRRGRWFIRAGSQNFLFTDGAISDLSNGLTEYVGVSTAAPDGNIVPAMWTFSESAGFAGPVMLDHSPGIGGSVHAVNDVGQAAGNANGGGAIWNTDGTRTDFAISDPSVFEGLSVRDINNSGDVVGHLHDNDRNHNRAYIRLSDGTMLQMPPLTGHVSSMARGVSEITNGILYVAGTSDDRQGNYRAVRWTINVGARAIGGTQARSDRSYSTGMADDGTITGDLTATAGTTPFVWRVNNTTVTLKAPKGMSSPMAWSISGNGRYISGQAKSGGYGKAVYWVATP